MTLEVLGKRYYKFKNSFKIKPWFIKVDDFHTIPLRPSPNKLESKPMELQPKSMNMQEA